MGFSEHDGWGNWSQPETVMQASIISRQKIGNPLLRHRGVELVNQYGVACVWHRTAEAGVLCVPYEDFADGYEVTAAETTEDVQRINEITAHIEFMQGDESYGLFANNCDHFAHEAFYGRSRSPQVELLGIGALLYLACRIGA